MAELKALFLDNHFVDGVCLPAGVTRQRLQEIKEMTLEQNDIFVVSYPKSGQAWTMTALKAIFHAEDLDNFAKKKMGDGFLDFSSEDAFDEERIEGIPNILRSNLRYQMLPEDVKKKNIKIINIKRNPKDVAVSYYHFCKMNVYFNYQGSWDTFFHAFIKGTLPWGNWFDYIKDWWHLKNDSNVLYIDYEDFLHDTPKMIRKLAQFVRRNVTQEQTERICEIISFESMQNNPNMNRMHIKRYDQSKGQFLRSGKVGDWKNYFTEEQEKIFNDAFTKLVQETGLGFTFE